MPEVLRPVWLPPNIFRRRCGTMEVRDLVVIRPPRLQRTFHARRFKNRISSLIANTLFRKNSSMASASNVLGTELKPCSMDPITGFFRDGCCRSGAEDLGLHLVCAQVTEDFLKFSKIRGNDLITPVPEFHFPGLKSGDRWCLCVLRWREAFEAGVAPPVVLESTHISTLEFVDLADLQAHSVAP